MYTHDTRTIAPRLANAPSSTPTVNPSMSSAACSARSALRGDRAHLTEREVKLVEMLAEGRTTSSIGRELYLSETMVKQTLKYAFAVAGVSTRPALVAWAFRRGVIT